MCGGIRGGVSRERRVGHSREGRAWIGLGRHLIIPPQWVVITRVRKVAVHFHFIYLHLVLRRCSLMFGRRRRTQGIEGAPECRYCQYGGYAVRRVHFSCMWGSGSVTVRVDHPTRKY